jgi:nicotinamidase/pyrazinamidase
VQDSTVKAVIVVDVQNDFCPGGSLPASRGAEVAAAITARLAEGGYDLAVATRDHHVDPGDHFSAEPDYAGSWPPHCVVGTGGVELHPALDRSALAAVFDKGEYAAAYSGFEARAEGVLLADWLRARGVDEVEVVGIATDYCVRATALDAVRAGFATTVRLDLTAAIAATSAASTVDELRAAGCALVGEPAL